MYSRREFGGLALAGLPMTLAFAQGSSKINSSVNGVRIGNTEKRLDPGDELSVAKHHYEVRYSPLDNGAVGPPPAENLPNEILSKSLLERAGLEKRRIATPDDRPRRYDVLNNEAGQIKNPNAPT